MSFLRKQESCYFNGFWTQAFAGVTVPALFTISSRMKAAKKEKGMLKKFECTKMNLLNKIRYVILYLTIQMKILLLGSNFAKRRGLKGFFPLFLGGFFFAFPGFLGAQAQEWPWVSVGKNFQVTSSPEDDVSAAIAASDQSQGGYLVVFCKNTPKGFDIYGVMISKDGEILKKKDGSEEFPICTAPNDQLYPAVSWNGENFLVVWQDRRSGKRWDIYGARVTPEKVLDPAVDPGDFLGFPISVGRLNYDQVTPMVSFDGENHLVVWTGKRNAKTWNIYFARVPKEGEPFPEPPVQVSQSFKDQVSPAVAFGRYDYFVVWQEKRNSKFWDIVGARVTPLGTKRDPIGKVITYSDKYGQDRWRPVLSWNGITYLVVWMVSDETDKWTLNGKRVGPNVDNIDLADLVLEKDGASKVFPAILRDGSNYLLVWEEVPGGRGSNISGASVNTSDKSLHVSETVPISNTEEIIDRLYPALSGIDNTALVVWQGKSPVGSWQIYGQFLSKSDPSSPGAFSSNTSFDQSTQ
ncbi:MAG: hypothetical protein A2156_03475 [Deltaproteobacteria bacterium RBG_16_48_10]|nr:MAG: hypothetical protein A2156_03475 [Deltaproteobacteria bacterium RBG_16_48_10]